MTVQADRMRELHRWHAEARALGFTRWDHKWDFRLRLAAKISAPSPTACWEWEAGRNAWGYGVFRSDGSRLTQAHRAVYEWLVGPIPDGLQLDHLCRNRGCVNPAHLEPVTQRENLRRGDTVTAKNAAVTHCPQGHPYDAANTIVERTKRGTPGRRCLSCRKSRRA